jgi:hypothetical protein
MRYEARLALHALGDARESDLEAMGLPFLVGESLSDAR